MRGGLVSWYFLFGANILKCKGYFQKLTYYVMKQGKHNTNGYVEGEFEMRVYPLHLRKKRGNDDEPSYLRQEAAKLNEGISNLFKDLDALKEHLEYMENKYMKKDEVRA
jgi:hypothetical protein